MFSPLSVWPMPLSPPSEDFFAPGKSSGNCHHHCAGWQMSPKERVKRTTHYKAFLGLDQERGGVGVGVGGDGSGKERHSMTRDGRREVTSGAQERDGKESAIKPGAGGPLLPPAQPSPQHSDGGPRMGGEAALSVTRTLFWSKEIEIPGRGRERRSRDTKCPGGQTWGYWVDRG